MEKLKIHHWGPIKEFNADILPLYGLDAETKTK